MGHSIRVLGEELGRHLQAIQAGVNVDLEPLDLQYGDYALWQQALAESDARKASAAYWKDQLAGMSYFELPAERPAPPYPNRRSERIMVDLADDFGPKLKSNAQALGLSPFALGSAAMAAALYRATGALDVSFSSPIACRAEAALEPLIGVFVNPAILRFSFDEAPSLKSIFDQASRVVSGAVSHGDYPFDALVRDMPDRRANRRTPLVSVNFGLQTVYLEERTYGEVALRSMPSVMPEIVHDLNVLVIGRADGWNFIVDYDGALFEEAQIKAIAEDLKLAFENAAHSTEDPLQPRQAAETTFKSASLEPASFQANVEVDPTVARRVADIWAEVLGRPLANGQGDFFDLGGHSLMSLRMLSRIEAEFGVRPSLADFLAATEFSAFCEVITSLMQRGDDVKKTAWSRLDLGGDRASPHLFVSVNQPFLYHAMGESLSRIGQCVNIHLTDPAQLPRGSEKDLDHVVAEAANMIAEAAAGRPVTLIGHCVDGSLSLRIAAALRDTHASLASVAMLDSWRPGSWAERPNWQRKLSRTRERIGRWSKHIGRLRRGQITLAQFIAENSKGRKLMARFGKASLETEMERQQIEINHNLVATLNGLPVPSFDGRVVMFCTESQPSRARKQMFCWRDVLAADTPIFDVPGWHETALLGESGINRITEVLAAQSRRRQ